MSENETAAKETVYGYEITQICRFKDHRGVAIAENLQAPSPYVTWQFTEGDNGNKEYYWAHYFSCEHIALRDFISRAEDREKIFSGQTLRHYRYYAVQHQILNNTYPRPNGSDPIDFVCFDDRAPVENGLFMAWGYIEYFEPLCEELVNDFGLKSAPNNPSIQTKVRKQVHITYMEQHGKTLKPLRQGIVPDYKGNNKPKCERPYER